MNLLLVLMVLLVIVLTYMARHGGYAPELVPLPPKLALIRALLVATVWTLLSRPVG